MYITRYKENQVRELINHFPITAIIGSRQCGKSTLAKHIIKGVQDVDYLDLENPIDMAKMGNPQLYFSTQKGKLICIDEIQRIPELFPLLRSLVDDWNRKGAFLILGSASRDLLRQSSESLAGRIAYMKLTPFLINEVSEVEDYSLEKYFIRGGFPESYLAENDEISSIWLRNFISTFLERDMLFWENFMPMTMRRLWQMLAHINGQTVNYSAIGSSLDISHNTVKAYIDLLASTFMVEVIQPWHSNMGKRIIKAPKVYIADSGVLCNLIGMKSFEELMGHPVFGSVWEQIVLTNLRGWYPDAEIYHYRTSHGAKMDFVLKFGEKIIAIECKTSLSPTLSKGSYKSIEDIAPIKTFVVTPGESSWPMTEDISVVGLRDLMGGIGEVLGG